MSCQRRTTMLPRSAWEMRCVCAKRVIHRTVTTLSETFAMKESRKLSGCYLPAVLAASYNKPLGTASTRGLVTERRWAVTDATRRDKLFGTKAAKEQVQSKKRSTVDSKFGAATFTGFNSVDDPLGVSRPAYDDEGARRGVKYGSQPWETVDLDEAERELQAELDAFRTDMNDLQLERPDVATLYNVPVESEVDGSTTVGDIAQLVAVAATSASTGAGGVQGSRQQSCGRIASAPSVRITPFLPADVQSIAAAVQKRKGALLSNVTWTEVDVLVQFRPISRELRASVVQEAKSLHQQFATRIADIEKEYSGMIRQEVKQIDRGKSEIRRLQEFVAPVRAKGSKLLAVKLAEISSSVP